MKNTPRKASISIHALHAEGDPSDIIEYVPEPNISIHALHAEGDQHGSRCGCLHQNISIHALHAEGDCGITKRMVISDRFQSTPSMRRATIDDNLEKLLTANFNPRPPCGGRLVIWFIPPMRRRFQSTPSMRRATNPYLMPSTARPNFNPRPPCGGRRDCQYTPASAMSISIHALHAEGDDDKILLSTKKGI